MDVLFNGFCLVAMPFVLMTSARADEGDLREVGLQKQLFVDDYVIDKMAGAKRVLNRPQRHADSPIIVPEFPWEGLAVVSPVVVQDEEAKCFHMYYWTHYDKDDRIFTCYARSTDGLRWEKPMLGLYEGPDGTKENNIVLRGEGRQARTRYVSLNPYAKSRDERFVMMYIDNVPNLTEFIAFSPDRIHWTTTIKIGDLRGVTGGPPTPNPRFFLVEQKWDTSKLDHRYRAIWRTESHDLKTWTGGAWAVQLHPEDDRDLEFYHATSHFLGEQTYHGLHLGYIYPYHTNPEGEKLSDGTRMAGTIDVELIVSRDTVHWSRVERGDPFFECGPAGTWDAGMVFLAPETVLEDELRFYYGGFALDHAAEQNRGAIGLATLRLDGFVSVEPAGAEATLTTKPFKLEGTGLRLNADAREGSIRVAVLDGNGNTVPGFTADDCPAITQDGLDIAVRWTDGPALSAVVGKPIRLTFRLRGKAKLYAFQFEEPSE